MSTPVQVRRVTADPTDGADYTSTFLASPVGSTDARAWAQAVFGGAPAPFRLALRLGWRVALRLRLDGDPELLGWPATSGAQQVRMAATGPLLDAANVVTRDGEDVRWTTVVRYRSRLGRVLWTLSALAHHRTLPWLIRRAARRLEAP